MQRARKGRRGRYRDDGEEKLWVKILAGLAIMAILGLIAWIGAIYMGLVKDKEKIDQATYCPKDGPQSVTSVLIDRTDGINPVQAEALKNLIYQWAAQVPKNGAFRIYEVKTVDGLANPVLSVCNPGTEADADAFTSNKVLISKRYQERFGQPVDQLIASMLTDQQADASPIMEAVQQIAVQDFPATVSERHLTVVSDLMQHTAEFSLYKGAPDVHKFRQSPYGRKVDGNLRGVSTSVYLLRSSSQKQTAETVQFWLDWLMLQGADLQGQFKVPG